MTQHPLKLQLLDLLRQAQIYQNAFFLALPAAELERSGTPDHWAAKDHVAHMTFWRQRLVLRLEALLEQGEEPPSLDFEQLNPEIFEEHRYQSWSDLLTESDQVYARLRELTEQLTEEDLTTPNRFPWLEDGQPLYLSFMGNCYEHTQVHLAQYLDEHNLPGSLEIYETWTRRIADSDVPEILKGYLLYNLACFYNTHALPEKALPTLQQAFAFYPKSRDFAPNDPDLTGLPLS